MLESEYGTIEFRERLLDRIKFGVNGRLGRAVLLTMDVRQMVDYMTDSMLFQLQGEVLGEKLVGEEHVVEFDAAFDVPDGWVQALKERHPWLWRVWLWPFKPEPVRVKRLRKHEARKVRFERYAMFPHSDYVVPPSLGKVVIHERVLEEPA